MAKERISTHVRAAVMAAHTHCVACGTWDARECGHIVSEAEGGKAIADNLVRLCDVCNTAQGSVSVAFAAYAEYSESRAAIETGRAQWQAYITRQKAWTQAQARVKAGTLKVNPYGNRPLAYG